MTNDSATRFDGELPAKPKRNAKPRPPGRTKSSHAGKEGEDPSAIRTFEEEGAGIAAKE